VHDVVSPELEADLGRLESGIRQLKIQYDMFFAGSVPRQPLELRSELERIIRRHSVTPIRRYASRFHFNALVSRFNSLSELWAKTLRGLEEGDRPAPAVADRASSSEHIVARCTVANPTAERDILKLLHGRLIDARKKSGEPTDKLSFEAFVATISSEVASSRRAATRGRATKSPSTALSTVMPSRAISSAVGSLATTVVSCPARASAAATRPPTPPAPSTATPTI